MNAAINAVLSTFWDERNAREKTVLAIGGGFLALFLAYQLLWAPQAGGRAELQSALPQMHAQLALMTEQANEARALKPAATSVPPTGTTLLDGMKASLVEQGLQGAELTMAGHVFQLRVKSIPFSNCIAWLDQVRRAYKIQVVEAQVTALPHPGDVNFTATLQGIGQ
jgi:general secretion pathway protein M